jgi:hypothetical protein
VSNAGKITTPRREAVTYAEVSALKEINIVKVAL